jgi:hypothetical protein
MSTDTDEELPEPAKPRAEAKPFLSSFSQADIKLLVLTFGGTLAANVVTVVVVAGAL